MEQQVVPCPAGHQQDPWTPVRCPVCVERDLTRYRDLLAQALDTVPLTDRELCQVVEAWLAGDASARGDWSSPHLDSPHVAASINRTVRIGVAAGGHETLRHTEGADYYAELGGKVRALSDVQSLALFDLIERFWIDHRQHGRSVWERLPDLVAARDELRRRAAEAEARKQAFLGFIRPYDAMITRLLSQVARQAFGSDFTLTKHDDAALRVWQSNQPSFGGSQWVIMWFASSADHLGYFSVDLEGETAEPATLTLRVGNRWEDPRWEEAREFARGSSFVLIERMVCELLRLHQERGPNGTHGPLDPLP